MWWLSWSGVQLLKKEREHYGLYRMVLQSIQLHIRSFYKNILLHWISAKNELFFASHTLKKVMQCLEPWLSQMKYLLLRSWPWNFLFLNVIEIFWTFVKRKESELQSTFLSDLKQKNKCLDKELQLNIARPRFNVSS